MRWLLVVMAVILLTACKTKIQYVDRVTEVEVPVTVETVRTEYINQLYRDSVFIHDSIDRYVSGDTVYLYKEKYIYKYMNRTDTVVKTDSIEVPVEVVKNTVSNTVEIKEVNKLKWYQTTLMWTGGIAVLLFAAWLVWRIKFKK